MIGLTRQEAQEYHVLKPLPEEGDGKKISFFSKHFIDPLFLHRSPAEPKPVLPLRHVHAPPLPRLLHLLRGQEEQRGQQTAQPLHRRPGEALCGLLHEVRLLYL